MTTPQPVQWTRVAGFAYFGFVFLLENYFVGISERLPILSSFNLLPPFRPGKVKYFVFLCCFSRDGGRPCAPRWHLIVFVPVYFTRCRLYDLLNDTLRPCSIIVVFFFRRNGFEPGRVHVISNHYGITGGKGRRADGKISRRYAETPRRGPGRRAAAIYHVQPYASKTVLPSTSACFYPFRHRKRSWSYSNALSEYRRRSLVYYYVTRGPKSPGPDGETSVLPFNTRGGEGRTKKYRHDSYSLVKSVGPPFANKNGFGPSRTTRIISFPRSFAPFFNRNIRRSLPGCV